MAAPVTAADKVACVKRELGQRRNVYPRLVATGSMSASKAAREIAVMEAILADCEAAAEKERLI